MTRAQDVLDYIDALDNLAERRTSYPAAERYGLWPGVQLFYDCDLTNATHCRIIGADLL